MNLSKSRLLSLGVSVLALGIILGTFFWLKVAPRPGPAGWAAKPLEGLNRYGAVPEFSLIERSGKQTTLADLKGSIWIADFIYTTCTDTCPMQTAEMARLQEAWQDKKGLKLVSFSVDPEKDTTEVLSRYADRYRADGERWLFLTGAKEEISRLVQQGFKLSAAPVVNAGSSESVIIHSPRFVLIDKQAQIRGYYDSRDQQALERLKRDLAVLING
ncbi:MAG TPA: SCO family protein [Candidatus Binatia bacterium]|nr:SCO family protein [Candidatus Binatia bacterium]